jgi:hypothetical protein
MKVHLQYRDSATVDIGREIDTRILYTVHEKKVDFEKNTILKKRSRNLIGRDP